MDTVFTATSAIADKISFDDAHGRFRLHESGQIVEYSAIRGYELLEDCGAIGKGSFARAFSGGMLSSIDGTRSVRSMRVHIIWEGGEEYIPMMITPAKSNSIVYKSLRRTANEILDKLRAIHPENSADEGKNLDYTEELRRLRALADDGVISEAEFDAKKKRILGL